MIPLWYLHAVPFSIYIRVYALWICIRGTQCLVGVSIHASQVSVIWEKPPPCNRENTNDKHNSRLSNIYATINDEIELASHMERENPNDTYLRCVDTNTYETLRSPVHMRSKFNFIVYCSIYMGKS
jgi:hypothetical protein